MEFEEWLNSIPAFTRYYMISILAVTATLSFGLIDASKVLLTSEGLFSHYYIWTIVTNFLVVGTFSFQLLFKLYLVYYAVGNIEKYHTPNKYADFIYLVFIAAGLVTIYSIIVGWSGYMSNQFILCLLYIYCKKEPLNKVRFMFGFVFKNAYLPWVILIYELLIGHSVMQLLIGIAAGHTYVVLKDVLPNSQYKLNLLETPMFVRKLVAQYGPQFANNNFGGFNAGDAAGNAPRARPFRFFRGQGVRIG